MQTRRSFLATSAATAGAVTILPLRAGAADHEGNTFETPAGPVVVHPIDHASFVMETPVATIVVDPVGDPASYTRFGEPDLVLVTHEHGDHYSAEALRALMQSGPQLIVNPAVADMLPGDMEAEAIANGESTSFRDIAIDAIPAYNTTEGRLNFHPEGRDNGYVLSLPGFRVYISGDTEDIPEMRALENIDLAFVCMNLPFTMSAEAAASAVSEFRPRHVYPYHYRGRDNGTQDPAEFAEMVAGDIEVKMGSWYG